MNINANNFKTILIMIDNQVGFNTTTDTKLIGKKIVELSNMNLFDYQIATMYVNNESLKSNLFTRLQNWHFLKTEAEYKYIDNLKYDYSLTKYTYTSVNQELLNQIQKINNNALPPCVFLAGMDTECCVLKTAIDFFEIGVIPILLQQYTSSNSGKEATERGLKLFERLISNKAIVNIPINSKQDIKDIIDRLKQHF